MLSAMRGMSGYWEQSPRPDAAVPQFTSSNSITRFSTSQERIMSFAFCIYSRPLALWPF
jgi:hypothetical protein